MTKFTLRMLAGLLLLTSLLFTFGVEQANADTASCSGLSFGGAYGETLGFSFDLNAGGCATQDSGGGAGVSQPSNGVVIQLFNNTQGTTQAFVQANNPSLINGNGFTNLVLTGTGLTQGSGSPGAYFYRCLTSCTINSFSTTDANGNQITLPTITITEAGGIWSVSSFTVTYTPPPIPAVTSISPSSGVGNGGTSVVITGTGFVNVSGVSIGGSPVTSFNVVSSTQINAVTEPHVAATGQSVDVSNANGSNTPNTLFTYTAGTCSAGTSATLDMVSTALNTNLPFNVTTLPGVGTTVPGNNGIYVACGVGTINYAPDGISTTTPGPVSITGASGGVYTLDYDPAFYTADITNAATGTYPHYVLKVTTAPPAGTDTLTLYYDAEALPKDSNFLPTDKTFILHLTNVVTVGPTMIANAGTTPQSATVNTGFVNALAVTVKDASNNPQSGVNVTFTAPGSGASGTFSNATATITVATNASGIASAPFTANATSGGPYTVTAAAAGFTAVNFSMTNTPITMTANAGTTPQSATVNSAFTNPVAVTVMDASSHPVPGINVTFTAPGSGASGTFSNSNTTIIVATDGSGIASAPFSANATAGGPYTVTAAAGVTTVNFSMTNAPGLPSTMTANAGTTPQSATISTAFANALGVTVKDASSNPVSGVNVTFTAPGAGASGKFSNSTTTIIVATNALGIASAPFTANATAGGPYTVTAAAAGVTTVNFSMTNTPGAPSTMTANAGATPQSATINTAFATALGVRVTDASSNPVSGVNVTFTAPGSGASGTFSNASATIIVDTDASGIASAPFTANATAGGPYTVTAAATSLTTVNFSMTNTQAAQAIAFGANPGPLTYAPGGTFAVSATGGASGNAVTFASSTAPVCTISGSTVSMVSAGTCTITANQLGNANYTAAPQVSQNILISHAAQTIVFTSTPPSVVAAGGLTYTAAATGGASGNAVTFSIDAASGAGVCSIAGSTVSFLHNGTCIVDANQAGNGSYAAAPQKQQTILVQNGVGPTVTAIGGFLSDRNNAIVTNLWDMNSTIDRLNDAPGGAGPGAGLADQDQPASQPPALLGGHALASQDSQYGTAIPALAASSTSPASSVDAYGLQQMVYGALRQLGETQSVSQLNYAGPFSAQMSTSGDMTGTFHTSLSQIMKWNDQAQQKEAASMGLNNSSLASAHQFNPLDVWMQGTYAAINSTQQSKFGLLSSGLDYVFNRNLLLGFYGQVDFMNQSTGLQAGGTGWMVGPYGTMRLSDQVFLEARGGYGRSSNSMTDALDPTLTDQFGSTRWLASAALAGRWQFGDHITFKPNFGFTYFTDSTDAYVNGLSVSVPSVTSQLGQFKFSPEVAKGFSLGDANWYEASIAPELIYNFTSTTADGLGSLDPTATGPQGLRGAIKWGVSMKTPTGLTIATQGSYDGIGANGYSAVTASARVNVPLN